MQAFVNKTTLEIIVTTRGVWHTPGEYNTPGYACIEFECPDDMQLARVTSLGQATPCGMVDMEALQRLDKGAIQQVGELYCSPDVELEPVPEVH